MAQPNLARVRLLPIVVASFIGCAQPEKATGAVIEFIRVSSNGSSPISDKQRKILKFANDDLNLLLNNLKPTHAGVGAEIWDGGSTLYDCPEYQITHFSKIQSINGAMFIKKGVAIRFKRDGSLNETPWDDASYTWLEPAVVNNGTSP